MVISDGHGSQSFMVLVKTVEKRKVGPWDAPPHTHTQLLHPTASPYKRHGACLFCVDVCVVCEFWYKHMCVHMVIRRRQLSSSVSH